MIDLQSTYRLLLLVLLVSFGVQGSTDEVNQCVDAGGKCIPLSDSCHHQTQFLGCGEDKACCFPTKWFQTRQVDPCSDVKVPRDCKKLYKGKCMTECSAKLIPTMDCNEDCKCCGCKIKKKCKRNLGHCIKKSQECEGETKNNWCEGKKCTCCIPENPCNIQSRECTRRGGICRDSCRGMELPIDPPCSSPNCVCCGIEMDGFNLLGCYIDSNDRILNGLPVTHSYTYNSPSYCTGVCKRKNFKYAGMEIASECWCGSERPPPRLLTRPTECDYPCPGNPNYYCGAIWRINIYEVPGMLGANHSTEATTTT